MPPQGTEIYEKMKEEKYIILPMSVNPITAAAT